MLNNSLVPLLILATVIVGVIFIRRKFKIPIVGSMALITGAVKSGKTTFSLALAIRNYKRAVFKWRIRRFFCKMFFKSIPEKPLFYSNVPVAFPYVQVTKEQLLRQERFAYKSVVYLSEASLVMDNKLYVDPAITEQIMLLCKLFGHETKGGLLIFDTQAIADLVVDARRCLGQTFYVHHINKWIPFLLLAYVKEQRYSEDGTVVQIETNDSKNGDYQRVIIPKSVWKKFDCYCYSCLTDNKPKSDTLVNNSRKTRDLKAREIVSFRNWRF